MLYCACLKIASKNKPMSNVSMRFSERSRKPSFGRRVSPSILRILLAASVRNWRPRRLSRFSITSIWFCKQKPSQIQMKYLFVNREICLSIIDVWLCHFRINMYQVVTGHISRNKRELSQKSDHDFHSFRTITENMRWTTITFSLF